MVNRLGVGLLDALRGRMGLALAIAREDRAIARAARRMPKPVPWDWARPRLMPLLAGPYLDRDEEGLVRSVIHPGTTAIFGIDLGTAFPIVDHPVARRWECSADQIRDVALENLRRRAARLEPTSVRRGTMSGYAIRMLDGRPAWASSLVMAPAELLRLFGNDDQIVAAPDRSTLISLPARMPSRLVADVLADFEAGPRLPLMLDPFFVIDGEVIWGGTEDGEDDDADEAT
jgi:uncharacterized protein YtpQ (UPF0354 family)